MKPSDRINQIYKYTNEKFVAEANLQNTEFCKSFTITDAFLQFLDEQYEKEQNNIYGPSYSDFEKLRLDVDNVRMNLIIETEKAKGKKSLEEVLEVIPKETKYRFTGHSPNHSKEYDEGYNTAMRNIEHSIKELYSNQ